jgi:beta-phosphoglucomutase-like phosphatase (HAD superfamily)
VTNPRLVFFDLGDVVCHFLPARRRTGVAAQATLLIDEAQANVQGAEATGWQVIHFTTPGALRPALRDLGVGAMGG